MSGLTLFLQWSKHGFGDKNDCYQPLKILLDALDPFFERWNELIELPPNDTKKGSTLSIKIEENDSTKEIEITLPSARFVKESTINVPTPTTEKLLSLSPKPLSNPLNAAAAPSSDNKFFNSEKKINDKVKQINDVIMILGKDVNSFFQELEKKDVKLKMELSDFVWEQVMCGFNRDEKKVKSKMKEFEAQFSGQTNEILKEWKSKFLIQVMKIQSELKDVTSKEWTKLFNLCTEENNIAKLLKTIDRSPQSPK